MIVPSGDLARTLSHDQVVSLLGAQPEGLAPAGPFVGVGQDDRRIEGDLFVAVRGRRHDPLGQIGALAAGGVRGLVGEAERPGDWPYAYYRVPSARRALSLLEQAFRGNPARHLRVIGVTGTNGKSTTVRLLAGILRAAGRRAGWANTVTTATPRHEFPSCMTTPEPRELARILAQQVADGAEDVVLEVSSHSLAQERVAGLEFAGAVFTNLSRDHYDYHGTEAAYLEAKLRLFRQLTEGAPAVIPAGGPVARDAAELVGRAVLSFGDHAPADAYALEIRPEPQRTVARLSVLGDELEVITPLVGRHNMRNVLASVLLARALGVASSDVARGVAETPPVRGRLERVPTPRGQVYVDYAHTPDALESVLQSLRERVGGRLLVVFGCGGDRDRGKRPVMGRVAEELADLVFVTSDNPRSEDPRAVIDDVLAGMRRSTSVRVDVDRRVAIAAALDALQESDVLVVAGKGHETSQEIAGRQYPFDDRQVVEEIIAKGER
ncbi:MAG: UDP-N-acetylmuramoyl-L-alanyl-D-glutamate--2,6-diaminopimelate ligase [Planctomycetota bacterium]